MPELIVRRHSRFERQRIVTSVAAQNKEAAAQEYESDRLLAVLTFNTSTDCEVLPNCSMQPTIHSVSDQCCVFGIRFDSDLSLPELAVPRDDSTRPDVRVRLDEVGTAAVGAIQLRPGVHVAPNDFLMDVPHVARYRVRDGVEIIVEPAPRASMPDVRLHLLGSALGVLCYQRGLQPLHANAIEVGGCCIAFAGPSGAGKSTLAAHLSEAGYRVLCDDLCVLSFAGAEGILVWPGLARFKLWKDSLLQLRRGVQGLERVTGEREKYFLPNDRAGSDAALPLRRLYVLERAEEGESSEIRRLTSAAALEAFVSNVYRPRLVDPLGKRRAVYLSGFAVTQQVAVYSWRRRWGYEVLAQDIDMLTRHFHD
jgi:hypothetical protein